MIEIGFFFLGFFLSGGSFADEAPSPLPFPITGRVYTDHYFFTAPLESTLAQSSASIWLGAEKQNPAGFGGKVLGQFDYFYRDLNYPGHASAHVQLREGYISYSTEGSDLRLGQQIIPWGKSDGVNPTDYFTAKDYTLLNPDDEVRRKGAPALNWNFTPLHGTSAFSFQAVIQAYYPQTRFIIPESVVPSGLTVQRYPPAPDAFKSDSMEYGFKIAFTQASYDLSVSAFRGFAAFPEYVFNRRTLTVEAINPRETAVGADASFTFSDWVARFESALHLPDNGSSSDPLFGLVEPWHWDSVLGIEKPVFTDFRIQVQALYRFHLNFADQPYGKETDPLLNQIQQGVGRANSTLLNYRKRGNPGATFRFAYAPDTSRFTADLFLIGYFSDGQDYLIRPQISFAPIENWKLVTGFDFYGGDTNGPLGALHRNSDGFFEAKVVF